MATPLWTLFPNGFGPAFLGVRIDIISPLDRRGQVSFPLHTSCQAALVPMQVHEMEKKSVWAILLHLFYFPSIFTTFLSSIRFNYNAYL